MIDDAFLNSRLEWVRPSVICDSCFFVVIMSNLYNEFQGKKLVFKWRFRVWNGAFSSISNIWQFHFSGCWLILNLVFFESWSSWVEYGMNIWGGRDIMKNWGVMSIWSIHLFYCELVPAWLFSKDDFDGLTRCVCFMRNLRVVLVHCLHTRKNRMFKISKCQRFTIQNHLSMKKYAILQYSLAKVRKNFFRFIVQF